MGNAHFVRRLSSGSVNGGSHIRLRSYAPTDREAVRQICCETADSGNPVESFFPDREVFADLLTRYYTDFEPQSSLVAVEEGRVVGYLHGCLRPHRFFWLMAFWIGPRVTLKALTRGTFFRRQVMALVFANLGLWLRTAGRHKVSVADYPAHLHINLRERCRGRRVGQLLMLEWLARACELKIPGVHAGVCADNERACRFFEAMGFQALGREPRMRLPGQRRLLETVVYGLPLHNDKR